ncbi:metal ABC transporter permease [Carboxylicivirga sp. M1479]|uniref:metal ABC transporter permease n=1 Tax=Carboxylicivirga sp. M1479 TaxID=2594476 RepID=UPI00117821AD|nr:metal ABC transporter permease [Carboxylicivirga sp. M1479]TRX72134.1 metal ABC transporter permease [Carboxylicivirga sp. M1479]
MNELFELFTYSFFRNALLASLFTSIIAGIVGSYIVAKRSVFISGGITHASFGGMGIAYYMGWPPFFGAAIFALLSALGIEWSSTKAGIREDSSIAILWSLGMAIGILFVFITPGYTPNLMGFLFGDVLTVQVLDLIWLFSIATLSIVLVLIFYPVILSVAFDSQFAKVSGLPVQAIKYVIAVFVAISIVLSIKVMGIILVLSLFTIPASAANLFVKDLKKVMFGSVIISVLGSISGLLMAYFFDLPSGATIIFTLTAIYLILRIIKWIK